jgi:DNA invertase Pin-like site-specific DNA recombinase
MDRFRTLGYVLGTSDPRRAVCAELQKKRIEAHCRNGGLRLDALYIDPSAEGDRRLQDRKAGAPLWRELRRNDHLVVTAVDRLDGSIHGFAQIVKCLAARGVAIHILELECVLDPESPGANKLIRLIVNLAESHRSMMAERTRKALAERRAKGERYARNAPFGFAWRRLGKRMIMVDEPHEQSVLRQVATMRQKGFSLDEIRQYLAYEWQVRNRNGGDFAYSQIARMAVRGAELLRAESAVAT